MPLATYQDKFRRLNVNVRTSPHKICMLLALLDLARSGGLADNRILFAPPLLERYQRFFTAVRTPDDHPNPYFPFFHLAGKLRGGEAGFWQLQPLPGRETALAALSTARSLRDITDNIACATLDPELFALLQQPEALEALAETLSTHWLDRGLQDLRAVAARAGEVSRYEHQLRQGATLTAAEALTPDMHWAMDRHLIAPGPDLKWHVSRVLDRRIPDFTRLTSLHGQPLFLPREARFTPKRESLQWRLEQLHRHAS